MSFQAKRELLQQVAGRYRDARPGQTSHILDRFVAASGYARKYAIRLPRHPAVPPVRPIARPRARHYGPAVRDALAVAWRMANGICAKRLVAFLPELVPTLERHGHLRLTEEVRAQLLRISPATADRLLRPLRQDERGRGISTTKAGPLLKHQVPVRTFLGWDDATPGFMEADLGVHCGRRAEGSYLYTSVIPRSSLMWPPAGRNVSLCSSAARRR
jgi:hypothetical protein